MGLFGKNRHDIVPKEKDLNCVVTKYSKVAEIKINAKVVVPQGHTLVIGRKGKALDKFEEGEHFFNFSNLPVMCRKFKIDDEKKYGNKKQFPADFYFIKNDIRCDNFETYRNVEMGTKAYGIFSTKVYGEYYYKVSDHKEFMQSLLNEYDYIKTGEAEKLLNVWANDEIVKILEDQRFLLNDVLINNPIIAETLKNKLSKLFGIAGLELLEVKITKFKLPKKYEKQKVQAQETENKEENINLTTTSEEEGINNLAATEEEIANKAEEVKNNTNSNFKEQITLEDNKREETNKEQPKDLKKQEYYEIENIDEDIYDAKSLLKEFGIEKTEDKKTFEPSLPENEESVVEESKIKEINIESTDILEEEVIRESDCEVKNDDELISSKNEQLEDNKNNEYVPFGNFVIETANNINNNEKKEKTFVDLSLTELYNNTEKTKRCLNCGTENNLDANHCLICGEKFNKGEFYENN